MNRKEDVVCVRVWLKPDSEEQIREWAKYIHEHRSEALQTLQEEGVTIESVFLDATQAEPCLIYYMRSASEAQAMAAAEKSAHAIDAYHKAFKRKTWARVERMELLLDLFQTK